MNYEVDINDELIKIVKAKDAELKLLYENGAELTRIGLKTKPFNDDEFLDCSNRSQRDFIDSLSHDKFNQTLSKCKSQPSWTTSVDGRQPKVEENSKESKVTVPNVEKLVKVAAPKQNSIQKKRPTCQVTLPSKKKLNSD